MVALLWRCLARPCVAAGATKQWVRALGVKSRRNAEKREQALQMQRAGTAAPLVAGDCPPSGAHEAPSAPSLETDTAAVRAGTDKWIRRFVLSKSLCPFAPKSKWAVSVHVDTQRDAVRSAVHKMGVEVDELMADATRAGARTLLSRFVVWPRAFRQQADFDAFLRVMPDVPGLLNGNVITGIDFPPSGRVVAMPFHPDIYNPALASPWPMLHLIPVEILRQTRMELGPVRQHVFLNGVEDRFVREGVEGLRQSEALRSDCQREARADFVFAGRVRPEDKFERIKQHVDNRERHWQRYLKSNSIFDRA